MIILDSNGRLGNQMFQYAIAFVVTQKFHLRVACKDYLFGDEKNPQHEKIFPYVSYDIVNQITLNKFYNFSLTNSLRRFLGLSHYKIYTEQKFNFDPNVFKIKPPLILKGFWQSEKYFKNYENEIIKLFTFRQLTDELSISYLNRIKKASCSVAIHVRRGDYVNDKDIYLKHGICNMDYYYSAINKFKSKYNNPTFFVFSDDPKWVKEFLINDFSNIILVESKNFDINAWKDMYLMSICDHQIIANSTFSWWAAWLNQSPNKYVIAPRQWFQDETLNKQTNDLIPENWIRV